MKLYSSPVAPSPKKVLIFIAEKGITVECFHPEPNLFGDNADEIAQIEMWYSRISFELMMPLMHGFRHTHPHMSALENQNNEFGLAQRELAVKSLKYYDEVIADNEYIACNKFSYADIQAVTSLQFLVRLNKIDINDYKNLSNYINNIAKRPSFS